MADNVSPPYQLDPTMEIITFSFVLYLQHDRHDVKCKPLIPYYTMTMQYHATTCHKISCHTIPYLLNSIISTFGNRRKKLNSHLSKKYVQKLVRRTFSDFKTPRSSLKKYSALSCIFNSFGTPTPEIGAESSYSCLNYYIAYSRILYYTIPTHPSIPTTLCFTY